MKITAIELKDYRAFYGDGYKIEIPKGKNLLIYGENGSGKSSIYKALTDFFESATNTALPVANHIKAAAAPNEHFVKITFTDFNENPPETIDYQFSNISTDTAQAEGNFISQTYTLKSFLSYKQLLRTYLFDTNSLFDVHFFKLLVEELIGSINNAYTNNPIAQDWKELLENPRDNDLAEQLEKGVNEILAGIIYPGKEAENIPGINSFLNSFLKYFNQDLKVQFKPCSVKTDGNIVNASVSLNVEFFGESINNHIEILNEARLSALALSVYFSSIRKSVASQLKYKILFLDDIFVGLDLSNRIPLLDILLKEFPDYQIFVTTYDRHWYELAKEYLNNWAQVELYVSRDNSLPFETPMIIDKDLNYFEKAQKYYQLKDYQVSGNLLRKEVERLIKSKLPTTYKISEEADGDVKVFSLEMLIQRLELFYDDCGIAFSNDLLNALKIFKKLVLNPSSHDDIKSPIYKKEIDATFDVVRLLEQEPKIIRKLLLEMHTQFKYDNSSKQYQAQIELADNLYYYKYGNNHSFTKVKFFMADWSFKGIRYSNMSDTDNKPITDGQIINAVSQARNIDEIIKGIFGTKGLNIELPTPNQFTKEIFVNGKSLNDIYMANYKIN